MKLIDRRLAQPCSVSQLTLANRNPSYSLPGRLQQHGKQMDVVTVITAGGVAAYAAIGISYLAPELGFSLQAIREAAVIFALVIAAPIVIDFFRKKPDAAS